MLPRNSWIGPRGLRRFVSRWGPWFGVIAPGIDFIVSESVALGQTTGYSQVANYISELTASDMRYSTLIRAWWIVFPVIFLPFVASLPGYLGRGWRRWVTPALLLVFALGVCFSGAFPCDANCSGHTWNSRAHFIASDVAAIAIAFSPLALQVVGRRDPRWQRVLWINKIFMGIGWAAGIALILAEWGLIPDHGLCERTFYGAFYLWLVFLAIHLVGLGRLLGTEGGYRGAGAPASAAAGSSRSPGDRQRR